MGFLKYYKDVFVIKRNFEGIINCVIEYLNIKVI